MPEGAIVRALEPADFAGLWPLLHEMSHGTRPSEDAPVPDDALGRMSGVCGRPGHCIIVAAVGDELVGYAWAQDYGPGLRRSWSVARLHDLFTTASWRRRGVGRLLFEAVRNWAVERETVKYLEWQASRSALPFYESLGFTGDTKADLEEHPFFEIELR